MARNVEILEPPIEGPSVRESEPMLAGALSKDGGNDRGLPMPSEASAVEVASHGQIKRDCRDTEI